MMYALVFVLGMLVGAVILARVVAWCLGDILK